MTGIKLRSSAIIILVFLLCLALGTGCNSALETDDTGTGESARVILVIDGDTFQIEGGERVRLIGIDCPEAGALGEGEATSYTMMELEGEEVILEKDTRDRDRYGRLLRYVYIDGIFFNRRIIKDGYAVAKSYPPDTRHQSELEQAEQIARESGAGLWSVGGIFE